jgi:hypothetical protein
MKSRVRYPGFTGELAQGPKPDAALNPLHDAFLKRGRVHFPSPHGVMVELTAYHVGVISIGLVYSGPRLAEVTNAAATSSLGSFIRL